QVLPGQWRGRARDVAHAGDAARHARRRSPSPVILAIETSCDDTCAAVVTHTGDVLSNVVASQGVHARFGGVVPEWASRHHLEIVNSVISNALGDVSLHNNNLVA